MKDDFPKRFSYLNQEEDTSQESHFKNSTDQKDFVYIPDYVPEKIKTEPLYTAPESTAFTEQDYIIVDNVTDWYLVLDDLNSSYVFPGPLKVSEKPILRKYVEILYEELLVFLKKKNEEMGTQDYREAYLRLHLPGIETLMVFRGNKIKSVQGEYWALRRVKGVVPDLHSLGISRQLIQVLTNPNLKSGLVLIVGETGNGKSTTCAATVRELCDKRGSFALTVEDPPELPLHGFIGKGVCIQTEVRKGDFAEAIRSAMRSYPAVNNSILYVGEIRDMETAQELIKVSANGHLVFATIHGNDIVTGIKRLVSSSGENASMADDIRAMLASSLRLVIHQELKTMPTKFNSDGVGLTKHLKINFLLSHGASSRVGNALIHNKIDSIINVIETQKNMLEARGIDFLIREEFSPRS